MVCTVNHAMEDLQHKIIQIVFILLLCENGKVKGERKDSDGRGNSTEQEQREKQKSKGNPGWQERVLHM